MYIYVNDYFLNPNYYITLYVLILYVGRELAAYAVFLQYYTELIGSLKNLDHLYRHFSGIDNYLELILGMDHSEIELLLPVIAMELHYGDTSLLYKMLAFMGTSNQKIQNLAAKIQQKVRQFNPVISSGM